MLTLEDIAAIYEGSDLPTETVEHLKQWVRTDPQFQSQIEVLVILADAAGLPVDDPNRLQDATVLQKQLNALIDAGQSWKHPAEILDPEGEVGLDCGALLKLAEAVQGKDDGIAGLLDRLRDAVEEVRRDCRGPSPPTRQEGESE
jgi:hypothetical protein